MLKLIFFSFRVFIFPSWNPLIISFVILRFFYLKYLYFFLTSISSFNPIFILDNLSIILIILSLWISFLILLARFKILETNKDSNFFLLLSITLILILTLAFSINNIIYFYILFEASLIPTIIIIIGWGYQPERLHARIYLLLYTVSASLPLLCIISIIYIKYRSLLFLNFNNFSILPINLSFSIIITLAFLVKIPLYITHLWLPKAHVEAPVAGSIILAGILLKLGSYGVIRLIIIQKNAFFFISPIISSISLWGIIITSFICIRQHDIKSLIAYSSVRHIALVILGILFCIKWGWEGACLIILAHGLARSGLFAISNSYYEFTNTRSIYLIKGITSILPIIRIWWFLLTIANIGAPPSLNILSEIILICRIISSSYSSSFILGTTLFLSAIYSLILFTSLNHGSLSSNFNFFSSPLSRNSLISLSHLIPIFFLFLTLQNFLSISF